MGKFLAGVSFLIGAGAAGLLAVGLTPYTSQGKIATLVIVALIFGVIIPASLLSSRR